MTARSFAFSSSEVFAGVLAGLIVSLITSVVAILTRQIANSGFWERNRGAGNRLRALLAIIVEIAFVLPGVVFLAAFNSVTALMLLIVAFYTYLNSIAMYERQLAAVVALVATFVLYSILFARSLMSPGTSFVMFLKHLLWTLILFVIAMIITAVVFDGHANPITVIVLTTLGPLFLFAIEVKAYQTVNSSRNEGSAT